MFDNDPYRQFIRSRLGMQAVPQAMNPMGMPEGRVPLPGPGYGGPQPGGYIPQEMPIGMQGPYGHGMGPEGRSPLPGPGMGGPQPGGGMVEGGGLGYQPWKFGGPEGRVPRPNPMPAQPNMQPSNPVDPYARKRSLYQEL